MNTVHTSSGTSELTSYAVRTYVQKWDKRFERSKDPQEVKDPVEYVLSERSKRSKDENDPRKYYHSTVRT